MTAQWSLSAEQFAAAWYGTGLDRLPFPFRFTSRIPGLREYQAYQQQFRDELAREERIPLSRTITVLAQPDWRIELFGYDNTRDGIEIRAVGCGTRKGAGVVAQQAPAPDGGRVQLHRCRVDQLATELVRLLPETAAGTAGEKSFLLDDLNDERPDPFGTAPSSEVKERYRRFWRQSCVTRGTATVLLGPRNAEPLRTGRLRWIDTSDGRYYEVPANRALMIRPGTSADIGRYLDEAIIRARARMDSA
ncbi:ESX secretion-associated protein EspG [Nocardia iowensis]|uniref:ESX secretion-associated protein EspG n=1 Tax=Nocardia iowensis TaxID=204891 RepID=A0ABX8RLX3_NOCIO|nr:ESX secretion-associated protein EspG [Nocardia iowensis]QXN90618.1 ESX secretion-associated protein EspG [Nocardia iowensis]